MTAASLAFPALAGAQASQGAIRVVATILTTPAVLPPPAVTLIGNARGGTFVRIRTASSHAARTPTQFVRVTRTNESPTRRASAGELPFLASPDEIELPASATNVSLHLERLILAGT